MLSHRNIVIYGTDIVSVWQGIEKIADDSYAIVGTKGSTGIFYIGPISGLATSYYTVPVPHAKFVSVYASNNLLNGVHNIVGSFRTEYSSPKTSGFIFTGRPDELSNSELYKIIEPLNLLVYLHDVSNKYIVGNADKIDGYNYSFIYNIKTEKYLKIKYPGSKTTTSYGIVRVSKNIYTICGGYSDINITTKDIMEAKEKGSADIFPRKAFLVNFDSERNEFFGWKTFEYPIPKLATHFEGVSFSNDRYQVVCNSHDPNENNIVSWLELDKNFNVISWVLVTLNTILGSGNSVANRTIVGAGIDSFKGTPYQVTIL